MEKYLDVMKQVTELTDTLLEGLKHSQTLVAAGKFEHAVQLLEDAVSAFHSVEQALVPIQEKLNDEELVQKNEQVVRAWSFVLESCEAADYSKVQELLQFTLIPSVQKWQRQLQQVFQPYIAS